MWEHANAVQFRSTGFQGSVHQKPILGYESDDSNDLDDSTWNKVTHDDSESDLTEEDSYGTGEQGAGSANASTAPLRCMTSRIRRFSPDCGGLIPRHIDESPLNSDRDPPSSDEFEEAESFSKFIEASLEEGSLRTSRGSKGKDESALSEISGLPVNFGSTSVSSRSGKSKIHNHDLYSTDAQGERLIHTRDQPGDTVEVDPLDPLAQANPQRSFATLRGVDDSKMNTVPTPAYKTCGHPPSLTKVEKIPQPGPTQHITGAIRSHFTDYSSSDEAEYDLHSKQAIRCPESDDEAQLTSISKNTLTPTHQFVEGAMGRIIHEGLREGAQLSSPATVPETLCSRLYGSGYHIFNKIATRNRQESETGLPTSSLKKRRRGSISFSETTFVKRFSRHDPASTIAHTEETSKPSNAYVCPPPLSFVRAPKFPKAPTTNFADADAEAALFECLAYIDGYDPGVVRLHDNDVISIVKGEAASTRTAEESSHFFHEMTSKIVALTESNKTTVQSNLLPTIFGALLQAVVASWKIEDDLVWKHADIVYWKKNISHLYCTKHDDAIKSFIMPRYIEYLTNLPNMNTESQTIALITDHLCGITNNWASFLDDIGTVVTKALADVLYESTDRLLTRKPLLGHDIHLVVQIEDIMSIFDHEPVAGITDPLTLYIHALTSHPDCIVEASKAILDSSKILPPVLLDELISAVGKQLHQLLISANRDINDPVPGKLLQIMSNLGSRMPATNLLPPIESYLSDIAVREFFTFDHLEEAGLQNYLVWKKIVSEQYPLCLKYIDIMRTFLEDLNEQHSHCTSEPK